MRCWEMKKKGRPSHGAMTVVVSMRDARFVAHATWRNGQLKREGVFAERRDIKKHGTGGKRMD